MLSDGFIWILYCVVLRSRFPWAARSPLKYGTPFWSHPTFNMCASACGCAVNWLHGIVVGNKCWHYDHPDCKIYLTKPKIRYQVSRYQKKQAGTELRSAQGNLNMAVLPAGESELIARYHDLPPAMAKFCLDSHICDAEISSLKKKQLTLLSNFEPFEHFGMFQD